MMYMPLLKKVPRKRYENTEPPLVIDTIIFSFAAVGFVFGRRQTVGCGYIWGGFSAGALGDTNFE